MAHRDLASRIHVRNAAESGQTRTDVNDLSGPPNICIWHTGFRGLCTQIDARVWLLASGTKRLSIA